METLILPDDHELCIGLFLERIEKHRPRAKRSGVIHLGAHLGEEVPSYLDFGYSPIWLFEANPDVAEELEGKWPGDDRIHVVSTAVGDREGVTEFIVHRTAKGSVESASILPLNRLGQIVPTFESRKKLQVPVTTIDQFAKDNGLHDAVRLMTLDIQGAELMALHGAEHLLQTVDAVICEVNLIEMYSGCPLEKEIDHFFRERNFVKTTAIYHELYDENGYFPAWGECLWMNGA